MEEGTVVGWLVNEGMRTAIGAELVEIETTKIANSLEAQQEGVLRRDVARVEAKRSHPYWIMFSPRWSP